MRKTLAFAALALTLSAPAFAQSTGGSPATGGAGMSNDATPGVSEGRAAAKDDSTGAANAARRGTERNGNENGNNMTRNNGQ